MNRLIVTLLLFTSTVFASDCPQFYPKNIPIVIPNTKELCNSFFVTVYDMKLKGPVFSSELVDLKDGVTERKNSFRPDRRLNFGQRAELSDYSSSPQFDRGHLTPAGDSSTDIEMRDTFLLSNMVPQYESFNRGVWKKLESHVRRNVKRPTIVVTGAIYRTPENDKVQTIGAHGIPVPVGMYKIVYWNKKPTIFYSENSPTPLIRELKFIELRTLTGIEFSENL
jgi:endonuclease G